MAKSKVVKIKWKVQEPETGRYRSFHKRGWPSAEFMDGATCAYVSCEDEYTYARVKTGDHKPLILRMAKYEGNSWKWVTMKKQYATLKELKDAIPRILAAHPEFIPDQLKVEE